jgi:hypothetical protein
VWFVARRFANAYSVRYLRLKVTQGCGNPGLKLVNGFAVKKQLRLSALRELEL